MRNTRKSGQILRSKKRPRPTLRSGRGSRTNSNTSHQIPARVIEADSARAVWVPDPRPVQPGAVAAVITVPAIGSRRSQHIVKLRITFHLQRAAWAPDDAKCRAWIVERGLDQHPA